MAILRVTTDGGATWVALTVGVQGTQGPPGPQGPAGTPGGSVYIKGTVANSSALPEDAAMGDGYLTDDLGYLWVKTGNPNTWTQIGLLRGPQGIPGEVTLQAGDQRYVKQAGGRIADGGAYGTWRVQAPAANYGFKTTVVSGTRPVEFAALDAANEENANKFYFDASASKWVAGAFAVDSLVVTNKVTSAATAFTDDAATLATKGYIDALLPVGTISMFYGTDAPAGWALCDGSAHGSTALQAHLQSLGKADPTKTPDLRGRFVVGTGDGAGVALTNRTLADIGGEEYHQLSHYEMPSHNHEASTGWDSPDHSHWNNPANVSATSSGSHVHAMYGEGGTGTYRDTLAYTDMGYVLGNSTESGGAHTHPVQGQSDGASARHTHSVTVENKGQDWAHNNMPPYFALTYIIRK